MEGNAGAKPGEILRDKNTGEPAEEGKRRTGESSGSVQEDGGIVMTEEKIAISKDVLNFLTGIYYEDNEDENIRKKKIFDRAFNMAYKDMATHTVAYQKDREEYKKYIEGDGKRTKNNKDKVKSVIKDHIKSSFVNEDNYSLTNLLAIKDPEDFKTFGAHG